MWYDPWALLDETCKEDGRNGGVTTEDEAENDAGEGEGSVGLGTDLALGLPDEGLGEVRDNVAVCRRDLALEGDGLGCRRRRWKLGNENLLNLVGLRVSECRFVVDLRRGECLAWC